MQQDHPDVVAVGQPGRGPHRARNPGGGRSKPAGAVTPPDPEADDIARKAADPAHRDDGAKTQRARMRRVAREQRQQQAVRRRVREHQAVDRIAVLADEFEERGEVGGKQQASSSSKACHRSFR